MILKIKLEIIGEVQLNKILQRATELGFNDYIGSIFCATDIQKRAAATYLFKTICNKELG